MLQHLGPQEKQCVIRDVKKIVPREFTETYGLHADGSN